VENSIIHGMEEGRVLTIYLRAEITSKGFILYIEDNGKGHCADQLNSYLCGAGAEEIDKQKMGVSNVNKRIAFVYGSGSELRYVNNDKGMTAIINIELDKKGGYEQ
ncbi:MAG: sensor histidine kinase, partial [Clostridia bacterium]